MRYVDELKILLIAHFPEFGTKVKDFHETAFVEAVAVAFGTSPEANPTDFSMKIIGMIQNGKGPSDGSRASGTGKTA
tara:strand:- start:27 stop:257 length:231 start_codon:yes stop_codon:yes gene_type:complete